MSESNSTTPVLAGKPAKPNKPYPHFPLYAQAASLLAKRIRGKLYYFEPWVDPHAALTKQLDQKDDLHAGRTPRSDQETQTVKELANRFLAQKQALADTGEFAALPQVHYKTACMEIMAAFGKPAADHLGRREFQAKRKD